jgi:hypothetical protein
MEEPTTPEELVEVLLAGRNPLVRDWEAVRGVVDLDPAALEPLRQGLDGDRERRWATAVVLARLGALDGEELARGVMSGFDWTLIPGPAYHYWEQAAWHLQDALAEGRSVPGVRAIAIDAIARADMEEGSWTDVVDEALGLLEEMPLDAETRDALLRVAAEHWNPATRDHANAILEDPPG